MASHQTQSDLTAASRREFLKSAASAGLTMIWGASLISCLAACGSDENGVSADSALTGFKANLTLANETALQTVGGFIRRSFGSQANGGKEVFVVRTGESEFKTASTVCTHEPSRSNIQTPSNGRVECSTHGSRYSLQSSNFGAVINPPASRGLQTFVTTFAEGIITIAF
jgi:Rieske Fe-S protein